MKDYTYEPSNFLYTTFKNMKIFKTCYLNSFEKQAEVLSSRLKWWNLFDSEIRICCFFNSNNEFRSYFSRKGDLVYSNGLNSIMNLLGNTNYANTECKLFKQSSKV